MQISQSSWNNYIEKLSAINEKAGARMKAFMQAHPDATSRELIDYAYAIASRYGEASATLACEMYDATAKAQGARVPAAEPAETATYSETGIAVNGAKLQGEAIVPQAVERLVKMTGQDTLLKNSLRDGAEFAWVPVGDTCAFCITLASRGWQRASKKAIKGGHAEHIHANCDCSYAIRFDGKSTIDGYDPDEYLKRYNDAGGDINAMRREQYASRKDLINAQKRVRYAEKKQRRERQFELYEKYGSETSLVLHGTAAELDEWATLKGELGFDENLAKNRLMKDSKNWRTVLESQTDAFRTKLGDITLMHVTDSELAALREWTGAMYGNINSYLRYGINHGPIVKSVASNIMRALDKAIIPETVIARRGIEKSALKYMFHNESPEIFNDVKNLIGRTFKDDGFFSTSPHKDGGFGGGIEMIIKIPKGTKGAYIERISHAEPEYELLLQRGYKFKIINAGYKANRYKGLPDIPVIWAEVINGK